MPQHEHQFVRVTRADYPMLRQWLSEPHVRAFWGDRDTGIAPVEDEVDGGDCRMRIVWAGRPFAYNRDWDVNAGGVPHFDDTPAGTRGADTYFDAPACHGRGHASRVYVRQDAGSLAASGAPMGVARSLAAEPSRHRHVARRGFRARPDTRPGNRRSGPLHDISRMN